MQMRNCLLPASGFRVNVDNKMAYMVVDNGHGVDKVYKKYICVERLQECK